MIKDLMQLRNFSSEPFFWIYYSLLFLFLFLFSIETALAVDPLFGTCVPKSCVSGTGPNISYPFWIKDQQPDYCGHPGFNLSCQSNEPVVKLDGIDFTVKNISYEHQSVTLVNPDWFGNSCTVRNLTFNRPTFSLSESNSKLFFYFNCLASEVVPLEKLNHFNGPCIHHYKTRHSFAFLNYSGNYLLSSELPKNCDSSISVPVMLDYDDDEVDDLLRNNRDYREVIKYGFYVKWEAYNCSECKDSGGQCGYNWADSHPSCFCRDRVHRVSCKDDKHRIQLIIGVSAGSAIVFVCLIVFSMWCYCNKRYRSTSSKLLARTISADPSLHSDLEKSCPTQLFSYKELEEATDNFDSSKELGDGGFGTVYHGILRDGRNVAVKRLYETNYRRVEQFKNEIYLLSHLHHQNLVTLYGCSSRHKRELLLVYEFVPNGTVADHLHGDHAKPGDLTLPTRMSIAIETADALKYLHAVDIVHRDVKTSNILLDKNFRVKVADFGLSRLFPLDATHVSTAPQGTPGYVDPDYYHCYQLTDKSDVYSYGVVLVELISSKPAVDISRNRHEINLADLAINKIQNDALNELVDPTLGFNSNSEVKRMITQVAELAFRCLQDEKEIRPSMEEVLNVLRTIVNEEQKRKTVEEVDTIADEEVLLKKVPPLSPDTVTQPWESRTTTPNTSG